MPPARRPSPIGSSVPCNQLDVRHRADGDQDGVGRDLVATFDLDGLRVDEPRDLGVGAQVDAGVGEESRDQLASLRTDLALARLRVGLEDDHVDVGSTGCGGNLGRDESTADDQNGRTGDELLLEGQRVLQRAQRQHPFRLAGERAGHCSGRDDRGVGAQVGTVAEVHGPDPQADGGDTQPELEVELLDPLGVAERGPLRLPRPGQDLLRQRRAVIRKRVLLADEGERPGVAVGAKLLAGSEPGQAGSDDNDGTGNDVSHGLFLTEVFLK